MEEGHQTTSVTIQTINTVGDGVESTQVLAVDPQLSTQAIAQSADGTAQIVDANGNTITLTIEHLNASGLLQVENVEGIEGLQGFQSTERQLVTREDGLTYYVISEKQAVSIGLSEQRTIVLQGEGIPNGERDQHMARWQHRQDGNTGKMELCPQQQSYASATTPGVIAEGQKESESDVGAAVISALNFISPEVLAKLGAPDKLKNLIELLRKGMEEKDKQLEEIENKLKETTEQNLIIAHALVSICKSHEFEDVIQNHGGTNRQTPVRSHGVRSDNLPFECPQCSKGFAAEHRLKRHFDIVHQKKRAFYCRFCTRDLFFPSHDHFSAHLRFSHKEAVEAGGGSENSPVFAQPVAAAASTKPAVRETFDVAIVYNTIEADAEAQMAAAQKTQKTSLTADFEEIEMEEVWAEMENCFAVETPFRHRSDFHRCDPCGEVFSTSVSLFCHIKAAHGKKDEANKAGSRDTVDFGNFICPNCQRQFITIAGFRRHCATSLCNTPAVETKESKAPLNEQHQQSLPFKCQVCRKALMSERRLEAHMRLKHSVKPTEKDHTCQVCSQVFSERDTLVQHMREHTDNIFPCSECDKKFIDEKFLRRHMVIHTQASLYTCEYCQKTFAKAESLKAHWFGHTGVKSHKCETCRAAFYTTWNLKNHMQQHSKTKTHVCEHCGRSFSESLNLEVHLRIHRNQNLFQCSSCAKTFSRIEHLKVHIGAHNGILLHTCPQCDRAFKSAATLLQHICIHSGEKSFQCGTCGKAFANRKLLQSHLESHSRNADDFQYVVLWEKGGVLQEAVIITDGVPLKATLSGNAGNQPVASQTEAQLKQEKHAALGVMEVDQPVQSATHYSCINDKLETGGAMDMNWMNIVDMNGFPISMEEPDALLSQPVGDQIQLTDEHGNTETWKHTINPIKDPPGSEPFVIQHDGNIQALDDSSIMSVQQVSEGKQPIYLSIEDLQALADQGALVEYQ